MIVYAILGVTIPLFPPLKSVVLLYISLEETSNLSDFAYEAESEVEKSSSCDGVCLTTLDIPKDG